MIRPTSGVVLVCFSLLKMGAYGLMSTTSVWTGKRMQHAMHMPVIVRVTASFVLCLFWINNIAFFV